MLWEKKNHAYLIKNPFSWPSMGKMCSNHIPVEVKQDQEQDNPFSGLSACNLLTPEQEYENTFIVWHGALNEFTVFMHKKEVEDI